jgi:hypothetical protein
MSLTGDWDKFRKMVGELHGVRGLMGPITRVAEGRVTSLFSNEFSSSQDPWGNKWAPTAEGNARPLVKTGNLATPQITASRGVVRVRPAHYWIFHQTGANNMKERAILPFGVSNWNPPIERAIRDIVFWHFRSKEAD